MSWVVPLVLENRAVRLEPIAPAHLPELLGIDGEDESLFTFQPVDAHGGPYPRWVQLWFPRALALHDGGVETIWVVRDQRSGQLVGSTRYLAITAPHRRVEIGGTWYIPSARGTHVNRGAKLALLAHAFGPLGCVRVELKTDRRNVVSQRAIEKLGATKEGTFRQHMILGDGFLRDTVYYSILDREWPAIEAQLQAAIED